MTHWRFCLLIGALMVELPFVAPAQAQGLLGQMFSSPPPATAVPAATDDEPTATTPTSKRARAPKPKPKPAKLVWRAPQAPPLPPPRPWGAADATFDQATQEFVAAVIASPNPPVAQASLPTNRSAEERAPATDAPRAAAPRDRSMVLIVRDGVRGPEDLRGRRIATGLGAEAPDELRRMVEENAGVTVSAVAIGWSAGLHSLARGDVDGVLLSLGPRIAASETEGVTLAGYQLLEIPIASSAP